MTAFAVFFRTKHPDDPSPFPKRRVPRHDGVSNGIRTHCFVTILEAETSKKVWEQVFRLYPDYEEAGVTPLSEHPMMADPKNPDKMIPVDLEWLHKRYNS